MLCSVYVRHTVFVPVHEKNNLLFTYNINVEKCDGIYIKLI